MSNLRAWSWLGAGLLTAGLAGACGGGGAALSPADFTETRGDVEDVEQRAEAAQVAPAAVEPRTPATRQQEANGESRDASEPPDAAATSAQAAAEDREVNGASTRPAAVLEAGLEGEGSLELEAAPVPSPPAAGDEDAQADSEALLADAMVGQIRGRPVYASTIFRTIGEDVLEPLGRNSSRLEFRRQVHELIYGEVQSRVIDALILAEAERDLSANDRHQLRVFVEKQRESILAKHLGSPALAERALQEEHGHGLDEELKRRREGAVIERHIHQRIRSQVAITRREVERYYRDNHGQFNRPPSVTVRVMMVRGADAVEAVEAALESGEEFSEVARRHSDLRRREGGMVQDFQLSEPFEEFSGFGWDELNVAIRELEVGERTPAVPVQAGHAWAKLESMEGGESGSIKDVFLEIEGRLFAAEFNRLQQRHMQELLREGNYTPIDQMATALVEIAMSRFARRN